LICGYTSALRHLALAAQAKAAATGAITKQQRRSGVDGKQPNSQEHQHDLAQRFVTNVTTSTSPAYPGNG
jgi:hypothetical protein